MIHRTDRHGRFSPGNSSWQKHLPIPDELLSYLEIDKNQLPPLPLPNGNSACVYPAGSPPGWEKGNPHDPLLRQVLPLEQELVSSDGFLLDPVADLEQAPVPGLLQSIRGRALLITTGACGVNCRYCFRRHYPYTRSTASRSRLSAALAYLKEATDIREVILEWRRPLMLPGSPPAGIGCRSGGYPASSSTSHPHQTSRLYCRTG